MKVSTEIVQDIQKYVQCSEINIQDEQSVPFVFFQKIEDEYEYVKVEVQSKEITAKEDIK